MEEVKNAFLAPFSSTAATKTTPMKIGMAYALTGLVIGSFFLNSSSVR